MVEKVVWEISHLCSSTGTYNVTLTVTDDGGAINFTKVPLKSRKAIVMGIVLALAMLAFVGSALATTHYVPPGGSIQYAVDSADDGDTIIVLDGTYTENVIVDKRLTIRSEHGAAATIVQAGDSDEDVVVQFFDNRMQIESDQTLRSINAGGTETAQIDWTVTEGTHNISVIVDPYGELVESSETNNIAHTSISIGDFSAWQYDRTIYLKENSGNDLTDYQVLVNLSGNNFPAEANASGADIRFVDENGDVLNYWIEEYDYSAKKAMIWVKIPEIPANETVTLQMYLGNPSASAMSDGDTVFEFFDDFLGTHLDTNKWELGDYAPPYIHGPMNYQVLNSTLRTWSNMTDWKGIHSNYTISSSETAIVEAKVKSDVHDWWCILYLTDNLNTTNNRFGILAYYTYPKNHIGIQTKIPHSDWEYPHDLGIMQNNRGYKLKLIKSAEKTMTAEFLNDDGTLIDSYQATLNGWDGPKWQITQWKYNSTSDYWDYIFVRNYADSEPTISISSDFSAWQYNRTIYIKENSGNDLTDYQVLINLSGNNFPAEANERGANIRFVDEKGNVLNYWIDEYDHSAEKAMIWVKIPEIPANEIVTLQMYWGNPSATPASNGDAVFEFFDEFEGSSLDTGKWNEKGSGSIEISGSVIHSVREKAIYSKRNIDDIFSKIIEVQGKLKGDRHNDMEVGFGYISSPSLWQGDRTGEWITAMGWVYKSITIASGGKGCYYADKSGELWDYSDYYTYCIKFESNHVRIWKEEALIHDLEAGCSQTNSDLPLLIVFDHYTTSPNYDEYIDWVRVRKYTSIGPTVSFAVPVDLALTQEDVSFSNPYPAAGEAITIIATIHNICDADANDVVVQFFDNGMQIGSDQTLRSINAGGTGTAQVNWTATYGTHNFSVIVDPYGEIGESSETNNIAYNSITIGDFFAWQYNRTIYIKENSCSDLTDYQLLIILSGNNFPAEANESGVDIRFVDEYGNVLNYWIEEYDYSAKKAMIWVKVPEILANGTVILHMYWANPRASALSDGDATFLFFDDFLGTSLDTNKWKSTMNYQLLNSAIKTWSNGTGWKHLTSKYTILASETAIVEVRAKSESADLWPILFLHTEPITDWQQDRFCILDGIYTGNNIGIQTKIPSSDWKYPHDLGVMQNDRWYKLKIIKSAEKTMTAEFFNDDGTLIDRYQTTISDWNASKWSISQAKYNSTYDYWDYIFVRNYADSEPTISIRSDFSAWQYNRTIYIKENSGNDLTDYQVLINLSGNNFPAEANASGADIRFVDENGNVLNYWIEEYDHSAKKARIWVKAPEIPANEIVTLDMYWGNANGSALSSFDDTMQKLQVDNSTVALCHFDKGSGNTAYDDTANHNDGTIYGAKWTVNDGGQWDNRSDVKFSSGAAMQFDGVDDYVEVANSESLDRDNRFTIEAWVKINSFGPYHAILHKWTHDSSWNGFILETYVSPNRIAWVVGKGGGEGTKATTTFEANTDLWYYVVGLFDGTYVKLYINGNEVDSVAFDSYMPSDNPLYIGRRYDSSCTTYFNGIVDEVAIYNHALSAEEIKAHYERRKYTSHEPTVSFAQDFSVWRYNRTIYINENSGNDLTDYQVLINLSGHDFPAEANANGADIRFVDENVNVLNYWIEEYDYSAKKARIWVKVPEIPANEIVTFDMHWGNPGATPRSNGDATFLFFDDFLGTSLDTNKWKSTMNYQLLNSTIKTWSNGTGWKHLTSKYTILASETAIVEVRAKSESADPWHILFLRDNTTGWVYELHNRFCILDGIIIPSYQGNHIGIQTKIPSSDWKYPHDLGVMQNDRWYKLKIIKSAEKTMTAEFLNDDGTLIDRYQTTFSDWNASKWSISQAKYNSTYDYWDYIFVRNYTDSEPTISISSDSSAWQYNRSIFIEENSGNDLTDYQVLIDLSGNDFLIEANESGADIRFVDENGNVLNYWIDEYNFSAKKAMIWVKVPEIPANEIVTLQMYWGNPSATPASNGDAVFEFFDDFNDGNVSDWTIETNFAGYEHQIADNTIYNSPSHSLKDYLYYSGSCDSNRYVYSYKSFSVLNTDSYLLEFYSRSSICQDCTIYAKAFIDGSQIFSKYDSGPELHYYNHTLSLSSGIHEIKVGMFTTRICHTVFPAWFDDITIRKYTTPEPTVTFSPFAVPGRLNVNIIEPINYSVYSVGDSVQFNITVSDLNDSLLFSDIFVHAVLSGPDNASKIIPLSIDGIFFVGEYIVSSEDSKGVWVANVTAYNSTHSGLSTSIIIFTSPYTIHVKSDKASYVLGEVVAFDAEAYRLGVSGGVLSDSDVCLNLSIYDKDFTLVYGPESMSYDNFSQSFISQVDTDLLGKGWFNVSVAGEDASGNLANTTTDFFVADDFEVHVSTDKSIYDRGESVNISGAAVFGDGSAVDNATVSIAINVKGFTRTFVTDTNDDGEFNYTFNPFTYEAGNYNLTVTVDYWGLKRAEEADFSITGLYLRPESETLDMAENSEYVFNLTLFNLGESTLTGITASLVDRNATDNVFGVFDTSTLPDMLLPGENRSFALVVEASEDALGESEFSVVVSSVQTSDGVSEILVRIHPNKPVMDVNPRDVGAGLNLNQSSIKSFTISNNGYGTLRNVTLNQSINSWFQLVTNESLGDIPPGENVSVYFVISSSQVDVGNYFGVINVSSANYEPVSVDVAAYVSDSSTGSLLFHVGDPLGRNISGANISLIDELDLDTYNLTTDERGYALVENLTTGRYIYDVFSGNGTLPQMGSVDVEPMPTSKLVNVSLGLSLIDFDWDIEPMVITDIYNIILKLKFETDVPVPVLVAHPSFLGYNFEPGGIVNGRLHLINFGMVSIKDVKLQDVGLVPHAEMEFLVNDIPEIKAKGSTQVPFKIKFSEDAPRANVLRGVVNIRGSYLHSVGGTNVHAFADTNVPIIIRVLDTSVYPISFDPTFDPKFCVMCGGLYISPGIAHQNLTLDKYLIAVLTVLNHDLDFDFDLSEATNKYSITATNSNNMDGSDISFTPAIGLLLKLGLLELLPDEILGVVHFIRERYSDRQLHIITQNLEYYGRITHHSYSKLSLFFRIPLGGIKNLEKLRVSLPRLQHVDSVLLGTFNPTRISPGESSILTLNRVALGAGLELPQLIGGAAFFLFGPPGDPNCLAILPIGGVEVNVDVDIPHLPSITWYWPTPVPLDWPHLGDGEYHWRGDFWWPQRIHIPSDGPSDSSRDKSDPDYQNKPTVLTRTIHEVVKLSISQNATMERDAFWAGLGIYNRMCDKSIDILKVDIIVRDSEGRAEDKFFIRSPYLTGIGDIRGGSNLPQLSVAKAQWLIIPKPGAGGTTSEGKVYNISAKIRYSVDGVNYDLSTLGVPILVKPQPQIVLDYYIPSNVIANSPFKLAVKASNVGYGTARDFSIQSAQPVIYDNAAGLMIDFEILGGSESSLVCVDFGNIEPGESRFAWWELVTTLDGKFTEFTGTYTHSSELGGLDTSIITELNTHIILREIDTGEITYDLLVDSDRNGIPDYVIDSVYGTSTEVLSVDYSVTMEPTSGNPTLTISTKKVEDKWICTSVEDPYKNKVPIKKVERSDGEILSPQNYWMREGRILIVDDPVQEYTITYETLAPPNITNVEPGNITAICGDPIELNCLVTADIGVESVWLNYTTNNWTSYNIKIMDNLYNDSYATNLTLPGFDAIEYKMEARDKVRNIGKSSIYTITIIGGIVLFDESHDEIYSIDPNTKYSYSMFASILEEKGYEVKTLNSAPITTDKLDDSSIFVIPAPTKPFDTNEIKAIREFVSNGGGLILINEWGGDFRQGSNLNDISKDLGIVFNNDTVNDPTNNSHNTPSYALIHEFSRHYLTKDINEFLYPAGCSLVTNNSIAWADDDSYTTLPKIPILSMARVELGDITVLTATNLERGRVICIGDGDFCGDLDIDGDGRANIDEYDNKKLILNIVEWLSGGAINEPAVASFVYSPENPVVNQTETSGASISHDPAGNLKSYNWTYGDGENGGTYNVTLAVTDDDDGAINLTKVPLKSRMWKNLKSASVTGLIIAPTQNNLKRWWL